MELRDYLRIIRRRWLLIVAFLLLGIAGGAVATVLKTPEYAATARLFVSTPVSDDSISSAYQGGLFSEKRVQSYASLIQGTTIAHMVIDKLGIDETPVALSKQIDAKSVNNTVIVEITVTDTSPARAQQIAQATAEVFSSYVPQLEGAQSEATSPITATIVDDAVLPTAPVAPKPTLNLGLGAVLGLLVGLGLAFLRETLDNTVKSPAALHEITGAAPIGSIHFDPLASKQPLVTQLEANSRRIEAFRVLRTNLQFLGVDTASSTFVISSAVSDEGKTSTAVNLAITLAQAGQRILLLEADLRRPRVPTYLNLEKAVGLTTVLIGRAGLDDVIQPWGSIGLDVVTSGPIPPNPSELLQSHAMQKILDEARTRYDVIIIDAPPLLPVTDAAVVAARVDGAILVARFGKTTHEQVAGAAARLDAVEARVLGTVINFVPAKGSASYGYGDGYEDYAPLPDTKSARKKRKRADSDGHGQHDSRSEQSAPTEAEWFEATKPHSRSEATKHLGTDAADGQTARSDAAQVGTDGADAPTDAAALDGRAARSPDKPHQAAHTLDQGETAADPPGSPPLPSERSVEP